MVARLLVVRVIQFVSPTIDSHDSLPGKQQACIPTTTTMGGGRATVSSSRSNNADAFFQFDNNYRNRLFFFFLASSSLEYEGMKGMLHHREAGWPWIIIVQLPSSSPTQVIVQTNNPTQRNKTTETLATRTLSKLLLCGLGRVVVGVKETWRTEPTNQPTNLSRLPWKSQLRTANPTKTEWRCAVSSWKVSAWSKTHKGKETG